jgi:hypothetical protein
MVVGNKASVAPSDGLMLGLRSSTEPGLLLPIPALALIAVLPPPGCALLAHGSATLRLGFATAEAGRATVIVRPTRPHSKLRATTGS